MNCLNCQSDNTTDSILCPTCASESHFTNRNDCRCSDCATKRVVAARAERRRLAEIAWEEEMRLVYGWPIQAAA
jgi:hypothetical protein